VTCDLTNPIFTNEAKAMAHMEADRWPNGPSCPFCGSTNVHRMGGKTQAGMFLCNDCRDKFTVRTGTIFERSHIPLHKWLLATHLMEASKKGMSALQLSRMLGITYKSSWFMCHRIREAMTDRNRSPIGGADKAVEADESYFGGRAENRAYKPPPKKHIVLALVERDGEARSFHLANVTAKLLKTLIYKTVDRASYLMTDELATYQAIGHQFTAHGTVHHKAGEYTRDAEGIRAAFYHTNTVRAQSVADELKRVDRGLPAAIGCRLSMSLSWLTLANRLVRLVRRRKHAF
jgi:transposase-like protein